MKTSLLFIGISFSLFCRAQAPLLPLFEDTSAKWQGKGMNYNVCDAGFGPTEITFNHEIVGDTVFGGKQFTKIRSVKKYQHSCLSKPSGSIGNIHQNGNLFLIEKGGKIDTSLFFAGTTVGSYVLGLGIDSAKITKVDTIEIKGGKRRRFYIDDLSTISAPLIYLDGIGLLYMGPPYFLYKFGETNQYVDLSPSGYFFLTCFQEGKESVALNIIEAKGFFNVKDITVVSSCFTPLNMNVKNDRGKNKIYLEENSMLVTDLTAVRIEIYGADGRKVLDNSNSNTTDISLITTGIYLAKIAFFDGMVSYKFFKE